MQLRMSLVRCSLLKPGPGPDKFVASVCRRPSRYEDRAPQKRLHSRRPYLDHGESETASAVHVAKPGDQREHYVEQAARATVDGRQADVRGDRLQHAVFGESGANRALRLHRHMCVDVRHRYAARARTRSKQQQPSYVATMTPNCLHPYL